MEDDSSLSIERLRGRLLLPALAIARFAISPPLLVSGLLLVDIATTFGQPVGVMGQMRTISSMLSMISALAMAVLSIRFKHKSLLLVGLGSVVISALGSYLAPTYLTMLVIYSLTGVSLSMVSPMTLAMVGAYLPQEERSRAVGWLIAGNSLSYVIGAPLISYLAGMGSWRTAFLLWVLPVGLLAIGSVVFGIPPEEKKTPGGGRVDYGASFKAILTNRSALACLIGSGLIIAAYQAILVYGASFYRQQFGISTSFVSVLVIGGALLFTVGSVTTARMAKKFGRRRLIVTSGLVGGALIAAYTNIPDLWFSAGARMLGGLFIAFAFSASNSLTLEQVPEHRGTLMSLHQGIGGVGSALGAFIGGMSLLRYGYSLVGVSLGAVAITAAIVTHFLTVDPHSD